MNKIKLGVVFGGQSTEHDVSIVSGTSVIQNLNKEKYEIFPIYIGKDGRWYKYIKSINEIEILNIGDEIEEKEEINDIFTYLKKLDLVFPVLHGLYGEDGSIQGIFKMLNIPYVGCKILASSICMDKFYTKIVLEKAGINQAKAIMIKRTEEETIFIDEDLNHIKILDEDLIKLVEEKLKFPVFIKPSNSGSSVGVSKAKNKEELIKAINYAANYDKEILIEEAINALEVECAVLGNEEVEASCVGQILSAEDFYDFDSKYKNAASKTIIPANIDKSLQEEIRKLAIKAFKAVNGSGLSRVDFFVEKDTNKIYLNEINTLPGFTKISMYPKLWEHGGISYTELLDKLIKLEM